MSIVAEIKPLIAKTLKDLYNVEASEKDIAVNSTKPEFEGDYTLVLFGFIKQLKRSPEQLGKDIGDALVSHHPALFSAYNVIKGFLNLTLPILL